MGMLTSPFWLKLLWVLHLRLGMSTGATQPPEEEQEPAQDPEEAANTLPRVLPTRCSWCRGERQLHTILHHTQFGDGWGLLYLCRRCAVIWQLWEIVASAPQALEDYIVRSVHEFTIFWRGLISAFTIFFVEEI